MNDPGFMKALLVEEVRMCSSAAALVSKRTKTAVYFPFEMSRTNGRVLQIIYSTPCCTGDVGDSLSVV